MKRPTPSQIKKYDINQKIIYEMTNLESRLVLFSIITEAKDSAEISRITQMPLSTIYKKLHTLEELSLIYVAKMNKNGPRNTKYYKSRIMGIDIFISKQEPKLVLIKNKN